MMTKERLTELREIADSLCDVAGAMHTADVNELLDEIDRLQEGIAEAAHLLLIPRADPRLKAIDASGALATLKAVIGGTFTSDLLDIVGKLPVYADTGLPFIPDKDGAWVIDSQWPGVEPHPAPAVRTYWNYGTAKWAFDIQTPLGSGIRMVYGPAYSRRTAAQAAQSQPDAPEVAAENCQACDGCGQIADDEDGTPWTFWAELPVQSAAAVTLGLVKPIPCLTCKGTGKQPRPDAIVKGEGEGQ